MIKYDINLKHPLVKTLQDQIGILSDGFVHFTPEYYASQNWKVVEHRRAESRVELDYFTSDAQVIKSEFIILAATHLKILMAIDDCLDCTFSNDLNWKRMASILREKGQQCGKSSGAPERGNQYGRKKTSKS